MHSTFLEQPAEKLCAVLMSYPYKVTGANERDFHLAPWMFLHTLVTETRALGFNWSDQEVKQTERRRDKHNNKRKADRRSASTTLFLHPGTRASRPSHTALHRTSPSASRGSRGALLLTLTNSSSLSLFALRLPSLLIAPRPPHDATPQPLAVFPLSPHPTKLRAGPLRAQPPPLSPPRPPGQCGCWPRPRPACPPPSLLAAAVSLRAPLTARAVRAAVPVRCLRWRLSWRAR